ncbi:radical SAM protein [candidate division KSB1 bacterium]|nr:radical SAM protein [candidate division KSB1 bacterium]
MKLNLENHPCFNDKVRHTHARLHLPVAPRCNIQCKYCNRKFDCVNESRPGVSSNLLSPEQALHYVKQMVVKVPNLSVVGIAGPGDPFANPDETMETLMLIRNEFPDMLLCVSSNGLMIEPYVKELAELQVSHITLTINAIDPEISAQLYSWVRFQKRMYPGQDGARILLAQQYKALKALKAVGLTVKINTIVVPGVNDHHVYELTKELANHGADIQNCIPVYPVDGTPFEKVRKLAPKEINAVRSLAAAFIPQMRHCGRCRADAVGLIGQAMSADALATLSESARMTATHSSDKPYVAVGTMEGALVNLHLGDADEFFIFAKEIDGFELIEIRKAPQRGGGDQRWRDLAGLLNDCRTILVSGVGSKPGAILGKMGITIEVMEGLIEDGLDAIYSGRPIRAPLRERTCGDGCAGDRMGCG